MELYEEVDARRHERAKRRMHARQREERRKRVLGPVARAAKMVALAAVVYALLFFGCLWASS